MLNRRTLRIKAVQTYFALEQSIVSDYEIALQQIDERFQPNLNSMEPQDTQLLKKQSAIAQMHFAENYLNDTITFTEDADEEIRKAVREAVGSYRNQVRKDKTYFQSRMMKDVDAIYDSYCLALMLATELAGHVSKEKNKLLASRVADKVIVENDFNLAKNKVVEALLEFSPLQQQLARRAVRWSDFREDTTNWYRDILKEDEAYKAYQQLQEPTLEQDREMVLHIIKRLFFKNPRVSTFMEGRDLYWEENSSIVKSMAVKTIKSYQPADNQQFELLSLSANEEEDLQYFSDLFKIATDHNQEYETIIAERSENWKVDRIALIDKVILKMALTEMIHFPSIPIKVTINEFIEISKNYSTPKSKQFVNGLLDVLASDLTAKGVIKKSGRGLIDNK